MSTEKNENHPRLSAEEATNKKPSSNDAIELKPSNALQPAFPKPGDQFKQGEVNGSTELRHEKHPENEKHRHLRHIEELINSSPLCLPVE